MILKLTEYSLTVKTQRLPQFHRDLSRSRDGKATTRAGGLPSLRARFHSVAASPWVVPYNKLVIWVRSGLNEYAYTELWHWMNASNGSAETCMAGVTSITEINVESVVDSSLVCSTSLINH